MFLFIYLYYIYLFYYIFISQEKKYVFLNLTVSVYIAFCWEIFHMRIHTYVHPSIYIIHLFDWLLIK